jgi:hypothetical protein
VDTSIRNLYSMKTTLDAMLKSEAPMLRIDMPGGFAPPTLPPKHGESEAGCADRVSLQQGGAAPLGPEAAWHAAFRKALDGRRRFSTRPSQPSPPPARRYATRRTRTGRLLLPFGAQGRWSHPGAVPATDRPLRFAKATVLDPRGRLLTLTARASSLSASSFSGRAPHSYIRLVPVSQRSSPAAVFGRKPAIFGRKRPRAPGGAKRQSSIEN